MVGGAWWAVANFSGKDADHGQPPASQTPPSQVDPTSPASDAVTRSDKGQAGVSVTVTYITDAYRRQNNLQLPKGIDPTKELIFFVSLNTHSVELSRYSIDKISVAKTEVGEVRPSGWVSEVEGGGHHRSGYLRFPDDVGGRQLITGRPQDLSLRIAGIAGVDRDFVWQLPVR